MTWVFEGTVLPSGDTARLTFGQDPTGEQLPGRYAVAGLVDSHCHLTLAAGPIGPVLRGADFAAERLGELAEAGVSAVRDVGGNREVTLELARTADPDRPLVLAAGRFLAPSGRYFPDAYEPVAPEDLLAAVETEIADGATWLKLVGDFPEVGPDGPIRGSKVSPSYDIEVVEAMVELAHSRSAYLASVLPLAERYGVRVLTGSDAVGTVAAEIDQLVRHGLSVEQAITAASTGAQDFLGLTGAGNLVTYAVDPREHPGVLATPAAVVLNHRRIV